MPDTYDRVIPDCRREGASRARAYARARRRRTSASAKSATPAHALEGGSGDIARQPQLGDIGGAAVAPASKAAIASRVPVSPPASVRDASRVGPASTAVAASTALAASTPASVPESFADHASKHAGACVQPSVGEHVSVVHGSLSLHASGHGTQTAAPTLDA